MNRDITRQKNNQCVTMKWFRIRSQIQHPCGRVKKKDNQCVYNNAEIEITHILKDSESIYTTGTIIEVWNTYSVTILCEI